MTLLNLTQRGSLVMRPDVVATVMGEGAVLLDLRTKYFYSANKSAWAILTALEAGADVAALADACEGLTQDAATVDAFLRFLQSEDLLEPATSASWDGRLALAGDWITPTLEKYSEPLQRVMMTAFDPTIPLAE